MVNREILEQRRAEMLREAALNPLEEARIAGLLGRFLKTPKNKG